MMRNTILATTLGAVLAWSWASAAVAPVRVMILDGESAGTYHDWRHITPVLKTMLDETGLFETTVVTAPPAGADIAAFRPQFSRYQVVVMNYDAPDERW